MQNQDFFIKKTEECAYIKYDIKEEHIKKLTAAQGIYKGVFNRSSKEFKTLVDTLFYTTGKLNENSVSKIQMLVQTVAMTYTLLKEIDNDMLNEHLEQYGLKIIVDQEYTNNELLFDNDWRNGDKKRLKSVLSNWDYLFGEAEEIPSNNSELLSKIIILSLETQETIFKLNNEIKESHAIEIEQECDIEKQNFLKSVELQYKKITGKDINEIVEKEKTKMDALEEVYDIVNNGSNYTASRNI
jgi:hypothetical protein